MTKIVPSAETVGIISAFAVIYMLVLLRKTLQGKFDLYDFLMLSMVAGLQGAILLSTYVVFPLLGLALHAVTGSLVGSALATGLLYVTLLPSTVQSSVAFTSIRDSRHAIAASRNVGAATTSSSSEPRSGTRRAASSPTIQRCRSTASAFSLNEPP